MEMCLTCSVVTFTQLYQTLQIRQNVHFRWVTVGKLHFHEAVRRIFFNKAPSSEATLLS